MSAAADEMVDGRGRVRPHWRSILGALSGLSGPDLSDRALSLHRALEEDGIASLLPSEERVTAWRCDLLPMPIPAGEFAYLEAGEVRKTRTLWARAVRDGVAALGPDTPAGRRLAETLAFFEFLQAEMPALLERWRDARPHR